MGFLLVFIGSGLGGMARHGVGILSLRVLGPNFPWGTLTVNVLGSGLIGLIVALFAALDIGHQEARLFLTTGVMGGFTTFSTFSLDTGALWERGEHLVAVAYVLASIGLSMAALFLTMHLGRRLG